ncbi:MAG: sigma 54-interacting transcriptional regulator [Bacteroidetes bacterium]|nr:sigma 54-interacting transcriptional regulator [Bacteroidota bacterium]MBU1115029.1 sigma 54-interacting transcriptional regulator [Bacteroidota bacterium]MBU1799521.1 sigma 54-interacting transcriptional regulator [Bacteroidota bacterium]
MNNLEESVLFILEDESPIREQLLNTAFQSGFSEVKTFQYVDEAEEYLLNSFENYKYSLLIADLKMGEDVPINQAQGLSIINKFRKKIKNLDVWIHSAFIDELKRESLFQLYNNNIFKLFDKNYQTDDMHIQIRYYLTSLNKSSSVFVFQSEAMSGIMDEINAFINTNEPILILGESGVGKTSLASYIHFNSNRQSYNFEKINLAELPDELVPSFLFGNTAGAYTDGKIAKQGIIIKAHKGTLFIDEIGHISNKNETLLLTTLQDKKFRRIGATEYTHSDFRLISATTIDPINIGKALYNRIKGCEVSIPPLRERPEDIVVQAQFFHKKLKSTEKINLNMNQSYLSILQSLPLEGNSHELYRQIKRDFYMSKAKNLQEITFHESFSQRVVSSPKSDKKTTVSKQPSLVSDSILVYQKILLHCLNLKKIPETTPDFVILKSGEKIELHYVVGVSIIWGLLYLYSYIQHAGHLRRIIEEAIDKLNLFPTAFSSSSIDSLINNSLGFIENKKSQQLSALRKTNRQIISRFLQENNLLKDKLMTTDKLYELSNRSIRKFCQNLTLEKDSELLLTNWDEILKNYIFNKKID